MKWEYWVLRLGAGDEAMLTKQLNLVGGQGWEVVAVVPYPLNNHVFYLKRAL